MHIFFSVGEPSGDEHAAQLINELRRRDPGLKVTGLGGPEMEAAGCAVVYPLTQLAVMGLFRVLPMLRKFYNVAKLAEAHLKATRPDMVVLVDFPGFNWWIAKAAKKLNIPVVYFMPPQLWAWASWRIRKVRKYVSHVVSGLQFETEWYAKRNIPVTYVGHPFFDHVAHTPIDRNFCNEWRSSHAPTVAILPGSRTHEVTKNWGVLLEVMRRIHAKYHDVTFLVANYKEHQRRFCMEEYAKLGRSLPVSFFVGKTSEIIDTAECAVMVSGSVSLEMLARRTPFIAFYSCSALTNWIARKLVTVKYMSLPNLMVDREMMPEFLAVGDQRPTVEKIARQLDEWIGQPRRLEAAREELDQLRRQAYDPGAIRRTANLLFELADRKEQAAGKAA